jgi:hypothetical protein
MGNFLSVDLRLTVFFYFYFKRNYYLCAMKGANRSLEVAIKSAIVDSLKNYQLTNADGFLGDLYLCYDSENQMIAFFDDVEKELLTINLNDRDILLGNNSFKEIKVAAKVVLKELEKETVFEKDFIHKPFTVSLVDRDFIIIDELIFIDDDTLKLDEDFWVSLDKELDNFLKDLMK